MQIPPNLRSGDRIAILSPASIVNPVYIDGAADFFRSEGFEPVVMPHAKGPASGTYAASDSNRLSDLFEAYADPSIRAILCARGGYGCNHLIDKIPCSLIADNPKWLLGFSDVTALHSLSLKAGVVSLHSPMAKHLSTLPHEHYCTREIMHVLTRGLPVNYEVRSHQLAVTGHAEGILVGGNLAVFNGLADTPFDPLSKQGPKILFIEDISEQIYAVERMLIRMRLSGRLEEVTGIICGQFTEYRSDRNFPDMETMLRQTLGNLGIPLALDFPAGHIDDNLPLAIGAKTSLTVSPEKTALTLS